MQDLLNSVFTFVRDVLSGAGQTVEEALGMATKTLEMTQAVYEFYIAMGMSEGDAVDATEITMREILDKIESSLK